MNLLITSVGRRRYLVDYFKEALSGEGSIHVMNSNEFTPAFLSADHAVKSPLIYDDSYIPFLLDYCSENRIDALLSLFDVDLPVLAANREKFTEVGTRLIVSDKKVVDICNDKWKTFQFLRENRFNTPMTWIDRKSLPKEKAGYPLIIKPRWGMGSLSMFEADNEAEAEMMYDRAVRTVIRSPMLKYEAAQESERCVILQEKLAGNEYGLDVINDLDWKYQCTIVKRKLAMRAGETDCAQVVDMPALKKLGKRLAGVLKHVGNLDVDIFMSEGQAYVLEMNARFGGGYPFSHLAGVNLPKSIIRWMRGESGCFDLLREKIGVLGYKDLIMVGAAAPARNDRSVARDRTPQTNGENACLTGRFGGGGKTSR